MNNCIDFGAFEPALLTVEAEIGRKDATICIGKVKVYFDECEDVDCPEIEVRLTRTPYYSKEQFSLRDKYLLEPAGLERNYKVRYEVSGIKESDVEARSVKVLENLWKQRRPYCHWDRAWIYKRWFPMTVMVGVNPRRIPQDIAAITNCYVGNDRRQVYYEACNPTYPSGSKFGDHQTYPMWGHGSTQGVSYSINCWALGELVWAWGVIYEEKYFQSFREIRDCRTICQNPCDEQDEE